MLIQIDNIQSLHKIKIYKYDNIDSKSLNSNFRNQDQIKIVENS